MTLVDHPHTVLVAPLTTEVALLRTLIYADVFDYALTLPELQRYLIGERTSESELRSILDSSRWLAERVTCLNEFYVLKGREALVEIRLRQSNQANHLWKVARRCAALLVHLPFVRMVAVTGALAMNNVKAGDDIDYLIVTTSGRVWLARAFTIVLVRLARLVGIRLCPNYLLADTALHQDRHDLFVAHELAQMVPLVGHDLYWQMRSANGWATDFLPNANSLPHPEPDLTPQSPGRLIQRSIEWLLSGRLADGLEDWERRRKTVRFQAQLQQPGSAARLDGERVQGHFNDYGHKALAAYKERCKRYGV